MFGTLGEEREETFWIHKDKTHFGFIIRTFIIRNFKTIITRIYLSLSLLLAFLGDVSAREPIKLENMWGR